MSKNVLFIGLITVGLVFSLRLSAQSVSQLENNKEAVAHVIKAIYGNRDAFVWKHKGRLLNIGQIISKKKEAETCWGSYNTTTVPPQASFPKKKGGDLWQRYR
jgi:hypothetical protein